MEISERAHSHTKMEQLPAGCRKIEGFWDADIREVLGEAIKAHMFRVEGVVGEDESARDVGQRVLDGSLKVDPDCKYDFVNKRFTPGGESHAFVVFDEDEESRAKKQRTDGHHAFRDVREAPSYTFSRQTFPPNKPTCLLRQLRDLVEKETGIRYNCLLLNLCHPTDRNSLAAHKDDEAIFNLDVPIVSVSLTEHPDTQRRFFVIPIEHGNKMMHARDITLKNGDFLEAPLTKMYHGRRPPFKAHLSRSLSLVITFRMLRR